MSDEAVRVERNGPVTTVINSFRDARMVLSFAGALGALRMGEPIREPTTTLTAAGL